MSNSNNQAVEFHDKNIPLVQDTLKSLTAKHPIEKFIYIELLANQNKAEFLSNQPNLADLFLSLGKFSDCFYTSMQQAKLNNNHFFVWPSNPRDQVGLALHDVNLRNGLTVIRRTEKSIQTWAFVGANSNEELCSLFLNDQNVFLSFINCFQHNLKSIGAINNEVYGDFKGVFFHENLFNDNSNKLFNIYEQANVKRYFLSGSLENVYITHQELLCLYYLSQSMAYKQIGKILKISPVTARKHIDSIKLKTGIMDNYKLIELVRSQNLLV